MTKLSSSTNHLSSLLHLIQHSIRNSKRLHPSRHATVRTGLQQSLPDLNLSHPIPDRPPNMRPQFDPLAQRCQHNQIQKTPIPQTQSWTSPDGSPGTLLPMVSHISV
jgi:hypothetical protein